MPQKRFTMKDIARKAGVSIQTVSRVVNNSDEVAPETRQHIQQVIIELGYQPNIIARSLITRRTQNIGVMVSSLNYWGPNLVLAGIERQANDMGYALTLQILSDPADPDIFDQLQHLMQRQVDAVIWLVPEFSGNHDWWHEHRQEINLPILFVNSSPRPGMSVLSMDDRAGGRMATEHLLQNGCRSIGMISGPADGWEAEQRKLGWQDALLSYAITPDDTQVFTGNYFAQSGSEGLKKLIADFPEMDAIFVAGDHMALGVLHAAAELGLKIPQDLAVIGYDGFPETAYYNPPLSTLRKDFIGMGELAMRELHRMVINEEENTPYEKIHSILIQPHLVVRESCGSKARN